MSFVIRKFEQHLTLGEKMKAQRKAANITIGEMEEKTKISKTILKAFEAGDYPKLPEPLYARNFLKIIARVLQVDETYFLDLYEHECGSCAYQGTSHLPRQRPRAANFFVASRLVKIVGILCIALAIVVYLGIQIRYITKAPTLVLLSPEDGLVVQDAMVTVTGKSDPGSHVSINGTTVLLSKEGLFEQEVSLERGMNTITVEGAKRYSDKAVVYRRV